MSKNAYATIHFGSNPVYLELELYFFIMLQKYTTNDILYLYSGVAFGIIVDANIKLSSFTVSDT